MPYELSVTEVGPAEYPLVEVLRETIFGEVGHVSLTTLADDLEGKMDILALIAHLEGNPVGFKVGHRKRAGVYYSKCGGVLKEYRKLGLGGRMMDWQHGFAAARGYKQIYFNTFNHFPQMMLFGLGRGYMPVAAERRERGGMSFRFSRSLEKYVEKLEIDGHDTEIPREIAHDDQAGLYRAVAAGRWLTGIRHDFAGGRTWVLVEEKGVAR